MTNLTNVKPLAKKTKSAKKSVKKIAAKKKASKK